MHTENRMNMESLLHTRESILENVALQKENLAQRGKRMVDVEFLLGLTVGVVALFCFNIEYIILVHLLFLIFSVIVVTTLYILRLVRTFTRLEKRLLKKVDFKIQALREEGEAME